MRYKNSFCSLMGAMVALSGVAAVAQTQPANDLFANRQFLTGTSVNVTGTNVGATPEDGEPVAAGGFGTSSIWYSFRPASSGSVTIDTSGSAIDTVLGAYVGSSVRALTQVAANDEASQTDSTSKITFRIQANTNYYILVNGYIPNGFQGAQGAIQLNMNQTPDPTVRYRVSGTVRTNTAPVANLSGVIISLTGSDPSNSATTANTTTNGDGIYTIPNILAGNYTLRATKTGFTFAPEALRVNVTRDSNGNDFTATKIPDPVLPEMYISNVFVREGNAGTPFVSFNISMNTASKDAITVFFSTSNGTASSTTDYKGIKGTFTFAPGTTTTVVEVGLRPDVTVEADETFTMKITGAEGAKIVDSVGTATIVNDDGTSSTGTSARSAKLPTPIRVARHSGRRI